MCLSTSQTELFRKVLSDECLGAKLRVTENQCILFNSLTYVDLALLPQHWAFHAKVDSTPTFIYIYILYIYIYIYIYIYNLIDCTFRNDTDRFETKVKLRGSLMVSKLYNFSFQSGVLKLLKPSAPGVKETINSTCNWEISSAYSNSNVIMERNHKMSTTFDLCCLWSWSGLYDGFKDSWCGQWNQCRAILSKLSFSFFFFIKSDNFWW